jgi:aspartate-semialdehyde dehydrogenase
MSGHLSVGVLGATGTVGQRLLTLLSGHPWFRVTTLGGSPRSQGRKYEEAARWFDPEPMPSWAAEMTITPPSPSAGTDLVFSALDAPVAREVEPLFVKAGIPVISNASPFRMEGGVPLLVPEVNPGHLDLLRKAPSGEGFMVTNPNCSTTGLVLALKPLEEAFGIRQVSVTTLQAISGAGYPGIPAMDIVGNVLPNIPGEEEKLETEPLKIFGAPSDSGIEPASITISAQTNRVPVMDGHLLSISVQFEKSATREAVVEAFSGFTSPIASLGLPSAPGQPLQYSEADDYPQPRVHAGLEGGMGVGIGRLRSCPVLDFRFVALVHNTIRGAAGGAILNAELLRAKGLLGKEGAAD